MITGYEGLPLEELEREARRQDNQLALELVERFVRYAPALFHSPKVRNSRQLELDLTGTGES